jgi:hypothetical protein
MAHRGVHHRCARVDAPPDEYRSGTAIGMMHAASRRLTNPDGRVQRCDGESRIDRSADCVTDHAARSGIEDRCQFGEADRDRDVRQVGHPASLAHPA